jgi:probable rRNA maturation factor
MSGNDPSEEPEPSGAPQVLVSDRQSGPLAEAIVRSLVALAERTLTAEGQSGLELSLSFVEPDEMAALHERYLGEAGPTDVLAFPLGEDGLLGDVVVCPRVAAGNNPDRDAELRLLVVHGILHLLGYDHEEDGERAVMWARQAAYSGVSAP